MTSRYCAKTIKISMGQSHIGHKLLTSLIFVLMAAPFSLIFGQEKVEVTKPYLKLKNDSLIISYGFIGATTQDLFNVRLEITDSAGKDIPVKSLTGDIGDSITGGLQKIIVWNIAADNIYMNQNIFIEIISEELRTPENIITQPLPRDTRPDYTADNRMQKDSSERVITEEQLATVANLPYKKNNFLLSAVFPGWGLTRLSNGKPFWLIGVAGAGCIASSILFNRLAISSYDQYKKSPDVEKSENYFNSAEDQYLISSLCAYSAIAIWVIDLGAVTIRAHHLRKSSAGRNLGYISVGSANLVGSYTPALSVNYHF